MRVLVAITGASGFPLATSLLKALKEYGVERHLVASKNAQKVREYETDVTLAQLKKMCEHHYDADATHTRICSGGYKIDAMVVIPCSMKTLGLIAAGIEDSAITRAVGVNLKMERKVVIVPRETPMTLIQLENLVKAKQAGCSVVLPLVPYYNNPKTVQECTDYTVGRVLELLGIDNDKYKKWEVKE
jgi:4-hydroxy-3-polyprenylbenzoate decarboxylase